MAYDENLGNRARERLGREPGITERRMFGGLAMMLPGNMAAVVGGAGGLMVRVDPAEAGRVLAEPGAEATVMWGREMRGWVTVSPDACERDPDLTRWVDRGVRFARTLPAK
ncbi:TfoX/Sxy family protein [Micromonospora marina]|uniref:Transcriptional regulator of competence genes, TfoX/Sxy family n=1 Tax=Micromonospora marina TaxID=307120 RepID=A0A1C4ZEI9_9ACTN|nr:TfoX/Sxy family protein [Micromonospora marina]SCF31359.1 Transcriptional regulator of competence genes, TfoX/Sxy family [Micromonospora marina]